ncbi:MAG: hypothetical protein SOY26_03185, partial [Paludibacteraceae bacterium]|nr:hypothetical protein [Paludibacteraceae bacterium]
MKNRLFVLCTMLCACIATYAVQVWDGTAAPWTKGSGTESNPYLIETPANLAYLAEQIQNGQTYEKTYFMQTNDIDLNNKGCQVGNSSSRYFEGIYDGGQKQIINVVYYLFGYIKSATIQNLTIAGASTYPIINNANGNVFLVNCHNKSTSKITQGGAGLVNVAEQGCITLENCSNSAIIESSGYMIMHNNSYNQIIVDTVCFGGLVAKAQNIKMSNCHNAGDIKSVRPKGSKGFVAGLVGYANILTITQSSNNGEINFDGSSGVDKVCVAGLALGDGIINQSYNTGNVYGGSNYNVSVGRAPAYAYGLSNCTNSYCYSKGTPMTARGSYYWLGGTCTNCYCILDRKSGDSEYTFIADGSSIDVYYVLLTKYLMKPGNAYNAIARTANQMKSPSFVSLLNSEADYFYPDYTNINDGYPILRWQLEGTTMYKIRATCPSAQGVVSGSGEYPATANITLKAMPKDGYTFTGWSDGNTDNPRT